MTIDDIVLSRDSTSIATIDSKPVNDYNMVYLQSLCIKLKINGYKNKRREDMIRLLFERKRIQIIEAIHYPGESANSPHSRSDSGDDDDIDPPPCPSPSTNNGALPLCTDNSSTQLPAGGTLENTMAYSSPETRSMSRARRLLAPPVAQDALNGDGQSATTSSQKKQASTRKNAAKGSVPLCVSKLPSYQCLV